MTAVTTSDFIYDNPGDPVERMKWAAALPMGELLSMVEDYRKGSDDPADVDAYWEMERRVRAGLLRRSIRCDYHRNQGRGRVNSDCPDCVRPEAASGTAS